MTHPQPVERPEAASKITGGSPWKVLFPLVRDSWQMVRRGGAPLVALMLVCSLLIMGLVTPVIGWLFREALRANGMVALDMQAVHLGASLTITATLLIVIGIVAFLATTLQLVIAVLALRQAQTGSAITWRNLRSAVTGVTRKLFRPSSLPLAFYLFIVLPLSGFGFTAVLSQGIAIPPFITGELMKSSSFKLALLTGFIILIILNIRWSLTIPLFAFTDATGKQSLRQSWRLTKGLAPIALVGAVGLILAGAGLASLVLVSGILIPTGLADAFAPNAAPAVAGYTLGFAQMLNLLFVAVVTLLINGVLLAFLVWRTSTDAEIELNPTTGSAAVNPIKARRWARVFIVAAVVVGGIGLGAGWTQSMTTLGEHPQTLILGHRGFTEGGVENTIGGLEAAHAAGADLVEIDAMETSDGKFVVMHDPNLLRLAGRNVAVKDLTLAELTQITVRNKNGHEDLIPSLADYVLRADELGMPLLIEIKMGGADTADHVARLVAELEELGVLNQNIYHSLDSASVEKLKSIRPDLAVGYTMPFAGEGVPNTSANFLVIEEESASRRMQRDTQDIGLGYFVWTVNEQRSQRTLMREQIDGIVTDHPDLALASRAEMGDEQGLAGTLFDLLVGFVLVF